MSGTADAIPTLVEWAGGPPAIAVQSVHLVRVAPAPALDFLVGNFTTSTTPQTALAKLTLPFGIDAVAIHSDRSQPERTRALEQFKSGEIRVLVATDVAARGLDIEDLPYVVNFELPWNPQDYVHRIGRTGRAGVKWGHEDRSPHHPPGPVRRRAAARHRPRDAQASAGQGRRVL